jgi:Zn-dependent protease
MFGARWQLVRAFGIPIKVDASWLLMLALATWTLASRVFSEALPWLPRLDWWLLGLITALAFFGCILLHEMGHALVARALGIPIRGITLFLLGGVAEMRSEPQSPRAEFWMAIAGPVVSLFLSALFWLLASVGAAVWPPAVLVILGYLAFINLTVLVFNMIPAFPLDGGRVLRSALWAIFRNVRRATFWASLLGQGFGWLLIGVAIAIALSGNLIGGILLGLIAYFLSDAARGGYRQVLIREMLAGEPVRRFMNPKPVVVPPTLSLRLFIEEFVYRHQRKVFPVADGDHLLGFIGTRALTKFPRAEWDRHTVAEAMRTDVAAVSVPPETDALEALSHMERADCARLLVTDGDRLLGVVTVKDVCRFLHLKQQLETGHTEGPANRHEDRAEVRV